MMKAQCSECMVPSGKSKWLNMIGHLRRIVSDAWGRGLCVGIGCPLAVSIENLGYEIWSEMVLTREAR